MSAPTRRRWSREELESAQARVHAALEEIPRDFPITAIVDASGLRELGSIADDDGLHDVRADLRQNQVHLDRPTAMMRVASVLSRFRMEDLRAHAASADDVRQLQDRSILLRDRTGAGWRTLLPEVRSSILRDLTADELAALVNAQAQPDDELQVAIRAALEGIKTEDLRSLSTGALAALVQVHDGLSAVTSLPPREQIERKLQLGRMLEPLRQITRSFNGRATEMQKLRDYVGVLSTGSWFGDVSRAVGDLLFKPTPRAPFLVFGPGGVGKTTLIARFILDHALAAEKQQFPFAYLDFDRPTVMAEKAPTILIEAIRQIGLQYDAAFTASERLRTRWEKRLASSREPDVSSYVKDFAGFLDQLEVKDSPVLFVLDTFEEVQRRSDAYAAGVVRLVTQLSADVPRLRVVIAGRTIIRGVHFEDEIELTVFDKPSALAFLTNSGVDPGTAEIVVERTGGSPLTLTLAIELYRRDPEDLRKLDPAKLADEAIQTFLFDRILLHIEDPEVRKLAHPGLVLRRVTPEIIRQVLAVPCDLPVPDEKRAEELFEKLADDSSLVTRVDPRVLVHRSDVRRLMLKPLRLHRLEDVEKIHHAAIEFYRDSLDLVSRAELAYHALSLGPEHEAMLTDDLEPLLVNAMEELPLPSQVLLAQRYELALSEEAVKAADQETWERITTRRVTELMRTGDASSTPSILAERKERTANTELMVVEAQALSMLRRDVTARIVAARGLTAYREAGNSVALFRMSLVAAELERRTGAFDSSHSHLNDAEEIARRRHDSLMLAQVLNARAWLFEMEDVPVELELQGELAAAAGEVTDDRWLQERTLLRSIVAHVALVDPSIVARAMRLGALELRRADEDYLMRQTGFPGERVIKQLAESPTEPSLRALVAILRLEANADERIRSAPAARRALLVGIDDFSGSRLREEPGAGTRNVRLKAAHREELRDLLVRHYGNHLGTFVEGRYNRGLESVSFAAEDDVPRNAADLIRAAEREGWLNDLVIGIARSRFTSADVLLFLDAIGLGPTPRVASGKSAVPGKRLRALLTEYRSSLGALETRTCAIDDGSAQTGCGFLVGRGTVLTAPLALVGGEQGLTFDVVAAKGKTIDEGVRILVPSRAAGDVKRADALVHLNASLIDFPVEGARAAPDAPLRGAVELPPVPRLDANAPLFWLWRCETGTFLTGVEKASSMLIDGRCVVDATSKLIEVGAPCFDSALNIVGVHCGPSPRQPKFSVIAPVSAVPA